MQCGGMRRSLNCCGAATSLPDDEPWSTPLAWAQKLGLVDIEEILVKHGATGWPLQLDRFTSMTEANSDGARMVASCTSGDEATMRETPSLNRGYVNAASGVEAWSSQIKRDLYSNSSV